MRLNRHDVLGFPTEGVHCFKSETCAKTAFMAEAREFELSWIYQEFYLPE